MDDTRADSGSPEFIVRILGKVRRAVPEELADAHRPRRPDRTHVVRHSRGAGELSVSEDELKCETGDGRLYTTLQATCEDGDMPVCEDVDKPVRGAETATEDWRYNYNPGYVELQTSRAEEGDVDAQFYLGWIYDRSVGVPEDNVKAIYWYRKAAKQGHTEAQFYLGLMYLNCDVVPRDYAKATQWIRKAAEQGLAAAQNSLGSIYHKGEGVPKDYAKSVQWTRKGAEQGDEYGQFNLGLMYFNGLGVPKDDVKAAHWYRKAAMQSNTRAQFNLGLMYYYGVGVPEDHVQAYGWISVAAEQGDERATQRKGWIEDRLTPDQIAKGRELESEYWEKYVVPFQK